MYNLAAYPFPISFLTFIPILPPNKSQKENRDWVWGYINAFVYVCRLGSGSACRSMYGGMVKWEQGSRDDGMDSVAMQVRSCVDLKRLSLRNFHCLPHSLTHSNSHTHVHVHTHTHTHVHVHTRAHTHTHTCTYTHAHTHTHTRARTRLAEWQYCASLSGTTHTSTHVKQLSVRLPVCLCVCHHRLLLRLIGLSWRCSS